jgi:hypothetical protein
MTLSQPVSGVADELHIQAGANTQTRFDDIRIGSSLDSVMPPHRSDSPRNQNVVNPPNP